MPNRRNYQRELEQVIKEQRGEAPSLLLHACCAPCSSYVLEYLSGYFRITVFYYNPNIYPEEEYAHRAQEEKRLIDQMTKNGGFAHPVQLMEGTFEPDDFYEAIRGLEEIPEGGQRCWACFRLRLSKTAETASEKGFDYFTTTLSVSPHKNAEKLNEIGEEAAKKYGVRWLPSDFKKKNGYQRSIVLSGEYGLYRQNYCGCKFSLKESRQMSKTQGDGRIRA